MCVTGIIDISLYPVSLFLNNSVDITSVKTIKNCTGFELSQLSLCFSAGHEPGDNEQTLSVLA